LLKLDAALTDCWTAKETNAETNITSLLTQKALQTGADEIALWRQNKRKIKYQSLTFVRWRCGAANGATLRSVADDDRR
jgi:hypothetical protein